MKKLLWLGLFLLPATCLLAQSDWVPYLEHEDYIIEYKLQECNRPEAGTYKEYYVLQFTNNTKTPLEISFNRAVWYNGECYGCENGAENTKSLTIQPNSSIAGHCDTKDKALIIFNQMLDGASSTRLEKFELRNIQVNKL